MVDGEMAAVVVDLLTGPQSEEDRKSFIEHGRPDALLDGLPEALELATGVDPETHPEGEPAMGEHVERLLGGHRQRRSGVRIGELPEGGQEERVVHSGHTREAPLPGRASPAGSFVP